eukprot:scaffold7455_cov296-Pinguiococcus_pyrenoidosus.AAC.2
MHASQVSRRTLQRVLPILGYSFQVYAGHLMNERSAELVPLEGNVRRAQGGAVGHIGRLVRLRTPAEGRKALVDGILLQWEVVTVVEQIRVLQSGRQRQRMIPSGHVPRSQLLRPGLLRPSLRAGKRLRRDATHPTGTATMRRRRPFSIPEPPQRRPFLLLSTMRTEHNDR